MKTADLLVTALAVTIAAWAAVVLILGHFLTSCASRRRRRR